MNKCKICGYKYEHLYCPHCQDICPNIYYKEPKNLTKLVEELTSYAMYSIRKMHDVHPNCLDYFRDEALKILQQFELDNQKQQELRDKSIRGSNMSDKTTKDEWTFDELKKSQEILANKNINYTILDTNMQIRIAAINAAIASEMRSDNLTPGGIFTLRHHKIIQVSMLFEEYLRTGEVND